jgi:SOS-response transcriptional repressor LexA
MPLVLAPIDAAGADWIRAVPVVDAVTLTRLQMRILVFIHGRQRHRGITPTYREIGAALDRNWSTVAYQIDKMTRLGVISRQPRQPRAITINSVPAVVV